MQFFFISEPRPAVSLLAMPNTCLPMANTVSPHWQMHVLTRSSCPSKPLSTSLMHSMPPLQPSVCFLLPPLSPLPLLNDVQPPTPSPSHQQAPLPRDRDHNDHLSLPMPIPPVWPLNVHLSLCLFFKYTWPSTIHNAPPPSPLASLVINPPYTSPSLLSSTYGGQNGLHGHGRI